MSILRNNVTAKLRYFTGFDNDLYVNLHKYSDLDEDMFDKLVENFPFRVLSCAESFNMTTDGAARRLILKDMDDVLFEAKEHLNKYKLGTLRVLAKRNPEKIQVIVDSIDSSAHSDIALAILDENPSTRLVLDYGDWKMLNDKVAAELVKRGQASDAARVVFDSFDADGQREIIHGIARSKNVSAIMALSSKLGESGLHGDFFISSLCHQNEAHLAGKLLRDFTGLSLATRQLLVSSGQGHAALQHSKSFGTSTAAPKNLGLGR